MSDSDASSSYDESESSCSESPSSRAWTCDDIYPSKGEVKGAVDDSSSAEDSSSEEESDDEIPVKGSGLNNDSSSSEETSSDSESEGETLKRLPPKKHSSGEIAVTISAQNDMLEKAAVEESNRRAALNSARDTFSEVSNRALDISKHMEKEFKALGDEYDSCDETLKEMEREAEDKMQSKKEGNSEEKAKFNRRNMEREMRLAKARERIEKKKEAEEEMAAKERLQKKEGMKLDMSKAARVERAYSWYSRMAMPTREKMKERVEFMPASAGVTPDDVDLLPWNARGTFVSVAAMMRMNRTASSSVTAGGKAGKSSGSDSDSDSD